MEWQQTCTSHDPARTPVESRKQDMATSTMDSVQQQLADLMSLDADTELRFDEGVISANSTVLGFFSSVLRGAIEAQRAGDSASSTMEIPMNGLTKAQWLAVAPFWHPIKPAAAVQTWAEAELLLRIGSRFDLSTSLDKASDFIAANSDELTGSDSLNILQGSGAGYRGRGGGRGMGRGRGGGSGVVMLGNWGTSPGSSSATDLTVWKWLRLADELQLGCLSALVKRAVQIDRKGCSKEAHIQGLSAATLQQLLVAACG